jgi:hypothetical protein
MTISALLLGRKTQEVIDHIKNRLEKDYRPGSHC